MTYLVINIFAYLAIAFAAGIGFGWLLRARRRTGAATQDSFDALEMQSRIDGLERALDERNEALAEAEARNVPSDDEARLVAELNAKNFRIGQLEEEVRAMREEASSVEPASDEADSLITALHNEIARLRDELQRRSEAPNRSSLELDRTVKELEARLVRKAAELDRLEQALAREERSVRELERERDLQNKSLHVLHQQLELERERSPKSAAG